MRKILPTILLLSFVSGAYASEVFVDKTMSYVGLNRYVEVPAQRIGKYPIASLSTGSSLLVEVAPKNKLFSRLDVYVCSEQDYELFSRGQASNCIGLSKQRSVFSFQYDVQYPSTYYLVLDNRISAMVTKKADLKVTINNLLDEKRVEAFKSMLGGLSQNIQDTFVVQDFNWSLKSCGQSNAFSEQKGGHITFCSELFFELINKRMEGAIGGIIFHELGHTLLNLWGLPGWKIEETADEFALYLYYREGKQELAMDWISWLDGHDSAAQARNILQHGDTHPISVQRIRNAKSILKNPGEFMARWNRLVYPHMTHTALTKIAENPQFYDDKDLATKILVSR
ncbi:MAG: DUF4344 domain-containing metallopeptidase [Mariprofundaceae bacterium]